jgi:3-phenylpropionate/cinnamic acid dioxygenase small subunit
MGAGTWESHHAITALMFRYAELMDAADFDGIATLFEHARITNEGVEGAIEGPVAVRKLYERTNRVHDDGTTRTRHVNANVFVDIDEAADHAAVRSAFVVFQQTAVLALQPIVSGRYRDTFVRSGSTWRFESRHIVVDHVGDVREHLTFDLSSFVDEL